jgi:hypothetical protein
MAEAAVKYTFSGHESFQCRHLWLKKGYDYLQGGGSFSNSNAVVELGVGKNMVTSIKFWMKAFGLTDATESLTPFAHKLFDDKGWDPYLEDEASLWLLHYQLVKNELASTYSLVFNEFRRERTEFTKENYLSYIHRKGEGVFQVNPNTITQDFDVLTKMYIRTNEQSKDREDTFSGLLTELDLIKSYGRGKDHYYVIENTERAQLPDEVLYYTIVSNEKYGLSTSLNAIEFEPNSAGTVFALSRSGLLNKIENITAKHPEVIFNDHAGVKELQFKTKPDPFSILDAYYAN